MRGLSTNRSEDNVGARLVVETKGATLADDRGLAGGLCWAGTLEWEKLNAGDGVAESR